MFILMKQRDFIKDLVGSYPTKNKEGFTSEEIKDLVANNFPHVTKEQFAEKLGINTCMVINGEVVMYRFDVRLALRLINEDRDVNALEWD
jgi:hypothetical protein